MVSTTRADWRRKDVVLDIAGDDHVALGAAGQRGDLHMAPYRGGGDGEIRGLIQRADLVPVGEQDVDLAADQIEEIGTGGGRRKTGRKGSAPPASAGGMGERAARRNASLAPRLIEQVAFEVDDPGGLATAGSMSWSSRSTRSAEKRAHRALPVRGHQMRQRAVPGPARRRRRHKADPDRRHVVAKHPAQCVVAHLADIGALAAERGDPAIALPAEPPEPRSPAPSWRKAPRRAPRRSGVIALLAKPHGRETICPHAR